MEIKRIGENKVRCALTEDEIRELGFDIDEIIGNSETTQQFMRVVLGLVEEQEHINIEDISP
ncbi:MAG: adaptor protein MecA, partial [Clostridiales bacterium]|nr:adaptor protein MecA [Clostridiales bacterium]MDY4113970.1 adaptor protein MecA [Roseburia sp.]